ncbi:MAG: hypothetical protein H6673_03720 [Anaerolineales bacterium]|nr:hypothetical protein [Anaerolineales bacterium]
MSKNTSKRTLTRTERIATRIDALSRPTRMALNMWISLAVMGVVGLPLLFLTGGENGGSTISLFIVVGVWLIVYAAGWYALLGFDIDDEHPWQAGKLTVWVLILGVIMTFLAAVELIFGLLFAFVL